MLRRTLPSPDAPSEKGEHEGRPYWLWLPKKGRPQPWPAMLILHGAGSRKENHADFGRMCAAGGWAAMTYDARGHGAAKDEMGPQALGDVVEMARFLGSREGVDESRVCVRGSSMGGFWAIHAAATSSAIAGAIAICPAGEDMLIRGIKSGDLTFRSSDETLGAFTAWLGEHDLREAAELMGQKPLILLHAKGDERIPSDFSEELAGRKAGPKKLVILPGGHHRSIQHDPEMQSVALSWIAGRI